MIASVPLVWLPSPAIMARMIQVGQPAPSFSLPDQNGNPVALSELRGRWTVLYFYPKDDTPGCTVEACEFTAAMPDFRGLDAEVLGCSADGAAAHTKFIAKYNLGIRLLTDADKSVMQAYDAYGEKMLYGKPVVGVKRSTVLIAPDGTVAHHWTSVKAAGHAEQVRSKLVELRGGAAAASAAPAPAAPAPVAAPVEPVAVVPEVKAAAQPAPKIKKAAPAKKPVKAAAKPAKKAKKAAKPAPKAKAAKGAKPAKAGKKTAKKAAKKVTKKATKKARR